MRARALEWPTQCFPPLGADIATVTVGLADDQGTIEVEPATALERRSVVVWRDSYVPALIEGVQQGQAYRVVLERASSASLAITTSFGQPIGGFVVAVTRVETSVQEERCPRSTMLLRTPDKGGATFVGVSDNEGVIRIENMPAGRYMLQCNLSNLPVSIKNLDECVVLDLPGPRRSIVCEEFAGAAVQFEGDEVVLATLGAPTDSPFLPQMDLANDRPLRRANSQLGNRWPETTVLIGILRDPSMAEAELHVYGRRSGWSRHSVKLVPVSGIESPQLVYLPLGGEDLSALVQVRAFVREDKRTAVFEGEKAVFRWNLDGRLCVLDCRFGKEIRVPSGEYELFPGGSLGRAPFEPVKGIVHPGSRSDIDIVVDREWRRYRIEVRLPGGLEPTEMGISLKGNGDSGLGYGSKFVNVSGGCYAFWSPCDSHECTVFVRGYNRVTAQLIMGKGQRDLETGEIFVVDVQELIE